MTDKVELTEEQQLLAKPRINKVVQAAKVEFAINGIMNSKIKDIAKRAKVGEASVYRYFSDKTAIVNLVAYESWEIKSVLFENYLHSKFAHAKTGLDYLLGVFDLFTHFYYEHKDMLKFMEDYGNYLVLMNPDKTSNTFDSHMASLENQIHSLVDMGIADKSLDSTVVKEDLYDYIMMSLLPTIQNLAIRLSTTNKTPELNSKRLLNNIRRVFEYWIKNKAS